MNRDAPKPRPNRRQIDQWLADLDTNRSIPAVAAANAMERAGCFPALVEAIISGRLRTTLAFQGRRFPDSVRAFRHCIGDRSEKVLDCALFGLVFMRDHEALPLIEKAIAAAKAGSFRKKDLKEAAHALREDNPYLFSPGFHDETNSWQLPPGLRENAH